MERVVRSTSKDRDWPAWCGEVSDVRRLITLIREQASERRTQILDEARGHDNYRTRDLRERKDEPSVLVTISDGSDKTTGSEDSIVEEIDRRGVKAIEIDANFPGLYYLGTPGHRERLSLKLSAETFWGPRLIVESENPGWAKASFARLSEELDKAKPWWSVFRTSFGQAILSVPAMVSIAMLVSWGMSSLPGVAIGLELLVSVLVGLPVFLALIVGPLPNWLFPRFEVYGEGGSSTGTRRIVGLVSIALSVPIGILVNVISPGGS